MITEFDKKYHLSFNLHLCCIFHVLEFSTKSRRVRFKVSIIPSEKVPSSMHRICWFPSSCIFAILSGHLISFQSFVVSMILLPDSDDPDRTARTRSPIWAVTVR